MGPGVGLKGSGISRPQRESIPGPSNPQREAIPTGLSWPMIFAMYNYKHVFRHRILVEIYLYGVG